MPVTSALDAMPTHLLIACLLYVGSVVGLAGLPTVYGFGVTRALAQIGSLSLAAVAVLFMLRQRWTLMCMKGIAAASILGKSFFFPSERFYGGFAFAAQVLSGVEIVACIVIL